MLIFHIAEKSRWEAARLAGSYAQSTLGRTLEDEGFIHAARGDQWRGVLGRYYGDCTAKLVLLTIDTDLLTSPWREEEVGPATYPHIHGPLNPGAVVAVATIPRSSYGPQQDPGPRRTMMQEFLSEVRFRMVAATVIMVAAAACGLAAIQLYGDSAGLPTLLVVLVAGTGIAWLVAHRRDEGRSGARK